MKLTPKELQWIDKRMDWYSIKYQEIYDEILDHIITAIEVRRATGDNRPIDVVFQNVVDSNFNGYLGIDKIITEQKNAFQQKVRNTMRVNYRYHMNWQTLVLVAFLVIIGGFCLPANKSTVLIMCIILFIESIIPVTYAFISSRHIRTAKGKSSLIKGYVFTQSNLLMFIFYWITQLITWGRESGSAILKVVLFSPAIYILLFYLFAVFVLSIIKLCKQEFKIAG